MNWTGIFIYLSFGIASLVIVFIFMTEIREALLERPRDNYKDYLKPALFVAFMLCMSALGLLAVIIEVVWDNIDRRKKK